MNKYEVAVVYHPSLEVDSSKAEERVTKTITDNGGKITKTDNWGKRKLAYPINKEEHGLYVIYEADIPAAGIQKIESTLNIIDEVMRYLIARPDLKAIAKAEAIKAEKSKKAAERKASGKDVDGVKQESKE